MVHVFSYKFYENIPVSHILITYSKPDLKDLVFQKHCFVCFPVKTIQKELLCHENDIVPKQENMDHACENFEIDSCLEINKSSDRQSSKISPEYLSKLAIRSAGVVEYIFIVWPIYERESKLLQRLCPTEIHMHIRQVIFPAILCFPYANARNGKIAK